jgi:threonine dehydrogenase-like Zn-dependent dehydrogenase
VCGECVCRNPPRASVPAGNGATPRSRLGARLASFNWNHATHRLPLERAPEGYRIFNKKEENCTKVVLNPWN